MIEKATLRPIILTDEVPSPSKVKKLQRRLRALSNPKPRHVSQVRKLIKREASLLVSEVEENLQNQ